jgi:hypothetical protein
MVGKNCSYWFVHNPLYMKIFYFTLQNVINVLTKRLKYGVKAKQSLYRPGQALRVPGG